MENKIPKEHIERITKASTYFMFRNGPIKELLDNKKVSEEDVKNIQIYMENHLAYLYTVLLEENNLQKFDLIVQTMSKFYVNDDLKITLDDGGFDNFYSKLFPSEK
ncbi:MAG: hypothetical protein Q4B63_05065 [Clostridium perfringens]|nr:hypothetical protein [Clostridium perfringens]